MVTPSRAAALGVGVRVVLGILLIFTFRATAFGQSVVQVTNGDRMAGDVSKLERGELAFRTSAAGTIDIEWSQVTRLTSMQMLDVELRSGMRYTGTISSPADRELVVQTASGPTMPIPLADVVRIREFQATVLERTTGSADFGLTLTNRTTTYTFAGEANNRTRSYETDLTFDSFLSQQDEADTETRNNARLRVRRLLSNRWFAMAFVGGLQDDDLELDWRLVIGGGVGRFLVERPEMILAVEGGVDYDGEGFTGADETEHSAEAFGDIEWDFSPAGPIAASFEAATEVSLSRKRLRLQLDATVRREMFWDLYWRVNAFEDFDSDPPDDRPQSSFGLAIGVGWSF
jgi:hypothetical protein